MVGKAIQKREEVSMAKSLNDLPGYCGYPVDCGGVVLSDEAKDDLPFAHSVWKLLNGVELDQTEKFCINEDIDRLKNEFTNRLISFLKGVLEFIRLNKCSVGYGRVHEALQCQGKGCH